MKNRFFFLVAASFLLLNTASYTQFWEYQVSGTSQHLNGVFMLDVQNGWVCGNVGTLLKTTNTGQNWTQVSVTANDLNSIVFKNSNIGVAVGDNGIIIRTVNGGANWSIVSSGTTEQFRKVTSGSGSLFFAAGDNGLAAVSADNGATWTLKNASTILRFRGTSTAGTNKVWAVGESGLIKYSEDGGNTWSTQASGLTNELQDVQFINESVGFIGANSSKFLYTTNGGATWAPRNSGLFSDLYGIYFQDANIGWAVSIVGTIYFTVDGGISWISQPCGSSFTLREAYFLYQGRGWTVGDNGTVIMYNNPNFPTPVELNSFTASVSGNNVTLNWGTATETNNKGFELERGQMSIVKSQIDWKLVGFVNGSGTTTNTSSYSFIDMGVSSGVYTYRLKQMDFDGGFEYYLLGSEVVVETPREFSLSQNYPNPFNPTTKIKYSIPLLGGDGNGFAALKIYDVLGNEVAALVNEIKPAGSYEVEFNASKLSSGTYFYELHVGNFSEVKKMILTK